MVTEPTNAPVPERAKTRYYVGLAVASAIGAILAFFVLPNLYFMTAEGPAVEEGFQVTLPSGDGLQLVDPTD